MADIEVPKNLYLETDCDHKDDSNQEPPLPTSLVVRRNSQDQYHQSITSASQYASHSQMVRSL